MTLSSSKERDLPPMAPNANGWGSLARLVGSLVYGRYPDDEKARKRIGKAATATSVAAVLSFVSWQVWVEYRDGNRRREERLVVAIEKLAESSEAQREALQALTAQAKASEAASTRGADATKDLISLIAQREGLRPVAPRRVTATAAPMETRR